MVLGITGDTHGDLYFRQVYRARKEGIIHLIRGEIYEINGHRFFAFGGANSTDIEYRKEGKSWWREEKPNDADRRNAYENLMKHNCKVDYVLTHTSYPLALNRVGGDIRIDDVSDYLNFIRHQIEFKYWFFGHMHVNYDIPEYNTACIYKEIIKL